MSMRWPDRECRASAAIGGVLLVVFVLMLGAGDSPTEPLPQPPRPDLEHETAYRVVDVRAGNILVVALEGREQLVRLIGTYVPRAGTLEDQALPFTTRLIKGESVYLNYEEDWSLRDRHDRFWVYAYRAPDGLFLNLELIRQGYARLSAPDPFEFQKLFRCYEKWARKLDKGVWDEKPEPSASPTTRPATNTGDASVTRQPVKPSETLVYITPTGTKFHRKDCYHVGANATALPLSDACARGLTPCSHCDPPDCEDADKKEQPQ